MEGRQEPRTPGPNRGPLPLPKALHCAPDMRAVSPEAGTLASVCHDALISGSHVRWRDLISGAHLTFGAADASSGRTDQRTPGPAPLCPWSLPGSGS